ncbi:DUF4249 domain-containing protein [Flavobacterium beibuense]|uniref:DUF4249 domain-containing protein n=1 Tax=Flavobacterium beibuense TaxID=657326 RepID=UPI003A8D6BA0
MKKIIMINYKRAGIRLLSLLLLLVVCACEEVVNVDLNTGEAKLVIDAEILWIKGTEGNEQTIKISRMADYYNPTPPKVSGAQVYIEDSEGNVFMFNEGSEPGTYECNNFIPQLNGSYTLTVTVEEETFKATETLIPVPEINRVEQRLVNNFFEDEYEISVFFDDPLEELNFYLTDFVTDVLIYPDFELSDDEYKEGQEIKNDFSDEKLEQGTVVEITVRGISEQFYNYMNLILESNSSNPFATPPANIRGNMVNQTTAGSHALGYFRLCEANYRSYTIE